MNEEMKENQPLLDLVNEYYAKYNSLFCTLPITAEMIDRIYTKIDKDIKKYIRTKGEKISETEDAIKFSMKAEELRIFQLHCKQLNKVALAKTMVPKSFIVTLISQYDSFVSCLVRCMFIYKSELFNLLDRSISYKNLVSYKSIDDAKNAFVDDEIDQIMRLSHIEQLNWFEKKLNTTVRSNKELLRLALV